MRKKIILSLLLLLVLSFTTSCGENDKKTKDNNKSVETTAKPTNSPLPTAEISVNEETDGKNTLNNKTSGYKVSYDSKKLKMSNSNSSISFVSSDKKVKDELNLFLNITEMNKDSVKELGEQLKESYKGSVKIKETTIGVSKTVAECYTITDSKKITHKVYIIVSDKKSWYIELKCPSTYEKKYMKLFDDILSSMEFK